MDTTSGWKTANGLWEFVTQDVAIIGGLSSPVLSWIGMAGILAVCGWHGAVLLRGAWRIRQALCRVQSQVSSLLVARRQWSKEWIVTLTLGRTRPRSDESQQSQRDLDDLHVLDRAMRAEPAFAAEWLSYRKTFAIEQSAWFLEPGHEVTVFGAAGSEVDGEVVVTMPGPYARDGALDDWHLCEWVNLCHAVEQSGRFDVLHSHAYLWGIPLQPFSRAPMIHSTHIVPDQDSAKLWASAQQSCGTAISRHQWSAFPELEAAAVIPHGVDAAQFAFREHPEDYVLYLGRFVSGKGPMLAIETARQLGLRLVLAGPSNPYFREMILPLVDGGNVEYVGFVTGQERSRLLGGARALIYPIQYPEAFGLVLVEAMLCGTHIAAMRVGAVPEVLTWAIELCDVLDYLHKHKPDAIIFRDMKPSNVMVNSSGDVLLVDFGIAKSFQSGIKGTMIGTEGYSPPEQYRCEATPAADIYAMGATIHHALTRRDPRLEPPFSFAERPVRRINPSVSPELEVIINRALEYDPMSRYKSALEMKEALMSSCS